MFTLEQINNEVDLYNEYTGYNIPQIHKVFYGDFSKYEANVKTTDLYFGKYIIYISNIINRYHTEYQKSVLWHEFTHISDYILYKERYSEYIDDIMKSYSEAHAESIRLRYLLHLPINKLLGREHRIIINKNKKESLDLLTASYMNYSVSDINSFLLNNDPYDFDHAISNFCYMCGYLNLCKISDRTKLINYVLTLYPKKYRANLRGMSNSIFKEDPKQCASLYQKLKLDAMIKSILNITE